MGAWALTLRVFDSSGALVKTLALGPAASALGSLDLGPDPWDPSASPLTLKGSGWSGSYDGKDNQGLKLGNGAYLLEVESSNSGASQKVSRGITVISSSGKLISAAAWPNPAAKGSTYVDIVWAPTGQDAQAQVYNQAGELILDLGTLSGGHSRWELKTLADGVYFVALRVPGQRTPRLIKVALAR